MCKGCKRTFQESFTRVKRTYNIERFLCTLYKLINDEEEIVKFSDEEIIDEISNYLKDRPYNNIVIKKIKNISNATNIIVESYDLKFVAIFMAENEVQIHKFNTRNENGKYIINLINNKAKRYDCLATI